MRKNKVTKNCPQCKRDFETLNPTKVTYCSRSCNSESRRKYTKCVSCGEKFYNKDKRVMTCSEKCYKTLKNKDRIHKECTICGCDYNVPKCHDNSKYCSEDCRLIGFKNLDRTKEKIPNCKCNNCSKALYRVESRLRNLNFCSYECMGEFYGKSQMFAGENSGTWNGGKEKYYGENWQYQRRKVRKRDNYTCQKCGITEDEYGQELSVHHIMPFVIFDSHIDANKDENLTSVCEPCHRKIHSGDNHPSKFSKTYQKE